MTPHDALLANAAVLTFADGGDMKRAIFQYPPKVISDGRKGSWEEKDTWGREPVAIYASSAPRCITLLVTYINDGVWDHKKISKQVRLIRGYFQRAKDLLNQRNLVAFLKLWAIGGEIPMSFRMRSCDIKYSETMIMVNRDQRTAWPLRTDLTLDFAAWTREGDQQLDPLEPFLTPDWY